ncbi:MAG: FAD binding domain-containing protein, partial [Elusimicrobiota bacterium]
MRGDPKSVTLLRPKSVKAALAMAAASPGALCIAGGTDVMVAWNAGQIKPKTVIDLSTLGDWRKIALQGAKITIGALATHAEIQDHPLIKNAFPLLAQASSVIGCAQIQNRGTLGGNIANASPAGDTFPALLVYDARVVIVSRSGQRTVALEGFFTGVKKNVLRPGELISSIEIDRAVRSALKHYPSVYQIDSDRLAALRPEVIVTQAHCEVCAVS